MVYEATKNPHGSDADTGEWKKGNKESMEMKIIMARNVQDSWFSIDSTSDLSPPEKKRRRITDAV
jgi:hypothetical protein